MDGERETGLLTDDERGLRAATPHAAQMLHQLVKGASEYALMLLDPERRILYWNLGAERIFGYSEAEILGQDVRILFTPEDVELGVAHKELARALAQGWSDDERWHLRKEGGRFWATGVVTCLKDEAGEVIGYSKVLRDQTLRKKTEDELKSALSELTRFRTAVAHDLQEPLRVVSSYLALLERQYRGKVDERHDELLGRARESAAQLRRMLADLLELARADGAEARPERVDSSAIFDTAVSNLKVAIEESGAVVTRTSLPVVQAVPFQLVQLLQNLLSNAIKYRRPDEQPRIYVDAEPRQAEWVFSVYDNGIGVPPEQRETVFEAFRRLHSDQDTYPGTGLGLFICKTIVERHGGRIWLDGREKAGARVCFTLPRPAPGADDEPER